MIVKSKYSDIVHFDRESGKKYKFINHECEIPDTTALNLLQDKENYYTDVKELNNKWDGSTWTDSHKKIIFDTPTLYHNGYGKSGAMQAQGLIANGIDVKVIDRNNSEKNNSFLPKEVRERLVKSVDTIDSWYVQYNIPDAFVEQKPDRFVGYTMFEATHVPTRWTKIINEKCERLIVPCEQNKVAFRDSGVTCDIAVVGLGLEPSLFPERDYDRKEDDQFIFGIMGNLTHRKGSDILLKAFNIAFPKDKYRNVSLYIKTQGQFVFPNYTQFDPERYIVDTRSFSHKELVDAFFHVIDCFVFPTRGEGYGLPPVEAMMAGLPVIATNWSGCADFMHPQFSYPLDYTLVKVPPAPYGYDHLLANPLQKWAEPSTDHLIQLMHEVYNNRNKAKEKGKKASQYARKNLTHTATAQKLINYLDSKF